MIFPLASLLLLAFTTTADAAVARYRRRDVNQASLPQFDSNDTLRAQAIFAKREGWLYGPSLLGNASFFPTGALANARIAADITQFRVDSVVITANSDKDLAAVQQAVAANGGLNSLDDYARVLYEGQWLNAIPGGEGPGILANYTQDLLFSMERLSSNPYPLRRLASTDPLPFEIPLNTSTTLTTLPLSSLHSSGRLFVVDHSYQEKYTKSPSPKYGAACTAYFFIHPISGDFLPLAIKTNVGSDLVYTPLDLESDWLLAKIMFNVNDLFHAQMFHLVASHDVAEIVHQAALRTLSDEHPVAVLLERLMFQAYAIRPVGNQVLFNPGGSLDKAFYVNHVGAGEFVAEFYPTVGAFQANYLETDLRARGLIDSPVGPKLKHLPFYEDAKVIRDGIKDFMTAFVDAYYKTGALIASDKELAAWLLEASGDAQVIDFPCAPVNGVPTTCDRKTLVDLLTHFAYLTGSQHHALNTGDPVTTAGTLPFHPASLYAPIPSTKNVTDLLPFMPPVADALFQIYLLAAFNRPMYEAQNKTLVWAFSDATFLGKLNEKVGVAAARFKSTMEGISVGIRARSFDAQGLSQGMPFVWRSLDPGTVPFFLAV